MSGKVYSKNAKMIQFKKYSKETQHINSKKTNQKTLDTAKHKVYHLFMTKLANQGLKELH